MAKERYQNPVINDDLNLRLFVYNSNNLANVSSINEIEIYHLDKQEISGNNPDGRRLIETVSATQSDTGQYYTSVTLNSPKYVIGKYLDVWKIELDDGEPGSVENRFEIYPDLWYTSPLPIVHDFNFGLRPDKVRQGSKRYLIIDIKPNVSTGSDLSRYYENVAIVAPIKIFISRACGECVPAEADLRLVVDGESVELREKCVGYYFLDTEDMDCGIYDVWFELEFGNSKYISDKQKFQIF